ncbi:MAG: ATP-binding protein [Clostridia bacterium]
MNWINRTITDHLINTIKTFPAVLITGPRQVGKSSLLQMVAKDFEYITFDNPLYLQQAKSDPELFLINHSSKLILDEIQYIPELFTYLKIRIDEMRFAALQNNQSQKCLFLLSGSQAYGLMQNVSESLAGRLAILPLQGISYREQKNISCSEPFLPTEEYLTVRKKESVDLTDLWSLIHRGYMPRLVASNDDWETFYSSYVSTYIERDVNQISNIGDRGDFVRFMASVAARSGELLNYNSISKDLGISATTVKRWIQILETSGIIMQLYPYCSNHLKRMIKTPKVYFMDTGLMAWLTRWITPETIKHGAKAGQFFETFVVSEIVKSFLNAGKSLHNLYFYRDADQKEIDLIIEENRTVYPIEIKMTAKPEKRMTQTFRILEDAIKADNMQIGDGAIIDLYPDLLLIDKKAWSIPVGYL